MSVRPLVVRVARGALAAGALLAGTIAHAQQPPTDWRAQLLRTARTATFGPERAPVRDRSVPAGATLTGIPGVTFAAVTSRRGDVGVAGRITARAAYPRLRIPAGVSYLWVDRRTPVRMAIVPADAARPAYWLPTREHSTFVGTSTGSSTGATDLNAMCRANPLLTQLGVRRPAGGTTQYLLGACTCVNGRWMHTEGYGELLSATSARTLLSP